MNNRRNIFPAILVLFLFLLFSCKIWTYKTEPVTITNVASKQTFTLKTDPKDKHVWSIHLKITGELDGKAKIYTGYENSNGVYSYEIGPGKINMEKHGDWYEKECILTFEPVDCTSGGVRIEYDFGSD